MSWTPPETDEVIHDPQASKNNSSWTPPDTDEVVYDPSAEQKKGAEEPEKGFVSRVVDTVKGAGQEFAQDPAQAALAGGSAAAESYGSLKGGELLSKGLGKLGVNKAIATGVGMLPGVRYIKPIVEPALGMLEFAGGAALTQSGIKKGEEAVGISDAIDQSQAANPNISTTAGTAVMGGMAAKSLKGYKNMLANEGLGKTAIQAGGAAVGGAAFPYIDYGARKGINAVAGEGTVSEIPVPTSEDVLHSARDMALLGGMGYKAKPVEKTAATPENKITEQTQEETLPEDTSLSEEETADMEAALAGKKRAITALDSAAQTTSQTGTLDETTKALQEELDKAKSEEVSFTATPPKTNENQIPETEPLAESTPSETSEQLPPEATGVLPSVPEGQAKQVTDAPNLQVSSEGLVPLKYSSTYEKEGKMQNFAGEAPVISFADRMVVVKDVGGVQVPFYLSTGAGGKKGVAAGKWYPFFGIGEDGWINKATQADINDYYGIPELKEAAQGLDLTIGDIRNNPDIPKVALKGPHLSTINEGMSPMGNDESSRKKLLQNVAKIKERIEANKARSVPLSSADALNPQGVSAASETPVAEQPGASRRGKKKAKAVDPTAPVYDAYNTYREFPDGRAESFNQETNEWEPTKKRELPAPETPEVLTPEQLAGEIPEPDNIPEEAMEPEAPKPQGEVTKEARILAEAKGVDLSQITPNKQGNITKREINAYLKSVPKEVPVQEAPAVEPEVAEVPVVEEPIIEPDNRVPTTNVRVHTSQGNLGLSMADAERQEKDFFERVHSKQGVLPPRIKVSEGQGAGVTRYRSIGGKTGGGGINYDDLKTLETLKSLKTGKKALIFKQQVGGKSAAYKIDLDSADEASLREQLKNSGLENAALETDPATGKTSILIFSNDGSTETLKAVKQLAYENGTKRPITKYEGTGELVGDDPVALVNYLKESLGRLSSGGGDGESGGPDRLRMANSLWDLASEAGVNLGERPTDPLEQKDQAASLARLQFSAKKLGKIRAKIPEARRKEFDIKIEQAKRGLAQILGIGAGRKQGEANAVGAYLPAEWDEARGQMVPMRERAESGELGDLQVDVNSRPTGSYNYPIDQRELAWDYAIDKLAEKLAKRASGKKPEKRKTALEKKEAYSKQIETLSKKKKLTEEELASLAEATEGLAEIEAKIAEIETFREEGKKLKRKRNRTPEEEERLASVQKEIKRFDTQSQRGQATLEKKQKLRDEISQLVERGVDTLSPEERKKLNELNEDLEEATYQIDPWSLGGEKPAGKDGEMVPIVSYALDRAKNYFIQSKSAKVKKEGEGAAETNESAFIGENEEGQQSSALDKMTEPTQAEEPLVDPSVWGANVPKIKLDALRYVTNKNLPIEDRLAVVRKIMVIATTKGHDASKTGFDFSRADVRKIEPLIEALGQAASPEETARAEALSMNYSMEDLLNLNHRMSGGKLNPLALEPGIEDLTRYKLSENIELLPEENTSKVTEAIAKDFGGNVPSRISVVYDPEGGWTARIGGGKLEVNSALVKPENVSLEIDHEVGHVLWRVPEYHAKFDELWNSLSPESQTEINRVVEDLYSNESENIRFEEKRVRALEQIRTEALKTKQGASAWGKLVEYIKNFWKELTGATDIDENRAQRLAAEMVEMGRAVAFDLDGDLRYRKVEKNERFTERVSKSRENDFLAEEDKIRFRSQGRDQADAEATNWIEGGGSFESLMSRQAPLSNPVQIRAAGLFRNKATETKATILAKEKLGERLSALEIRSKNEAIRMEKEANQFLAEVKSEGGQILAHGQDLERSKGNLNPQNFIKMLLGGTTEELLEGKINLRILTKGIEAIKAEAAKLAVDALEVPLQMAGIEGEENLNLLRDILSDSSTSYKNVRDAIASLMPGGNPAKVSAMAEKVFRMHSAISTKIGKERLPKLVHDTYNGESVTPHGDAFSRKLADFLKLGKYDEDELNNALLESLGLSGYDSKFLQEIRKDIDNMNSLPSGDMQNSAKVNISNKVKKKFYNQVLKDYKNKANRNHIWDMITAAWQAGVLSGPPTAGVNLFGSAASITIESMMEATGYAAKTGDMKYFADVFGGFLSAITGGGKGGPSAAWNEIRSAMGGHGTKYRNNSLQDAPLLENLDADGLKGAVKVLAQHGNNLRWVGRIMGALDAINMTAADEAKQRMAMRFFLSESKGYEQSEVTRMMDELFNPDEVIVGNFKKLAEADVAKYLPNATAKEKSRWVGRRALELAHQKREQQLPGVTEQGAAAAERYTYNEASRGFLGKLVGLTSQINQALPQGRFIFSFMNTLANIINQTLDYTPYGFFRANNKSYSQTHVKRTDKNAPHFYEEGSPEQMAERARAYLGTSAIMALAYMAYKGLTDEQEGKEPFFSIHGAGPKDPYVRQEMQDTGNWQANSIKVGGVWLRYVDFPILGSLLGGLGTAFDAFRYKRDEQTTSELMGQAVMSGVTTILDKNLLQGANNLFQVFRGDSPGQQYSSLKRLSGGVVSGFTNPGLFRWARGTFDMDKDGMVNKLDNTTTQGWLMSMVPASIGYNTPALNALGEPIKQPWYMASTWRFSNLGNKPHPVFTPLVKAGLVVPPPNKATSFSVNQPDGSVLKTRMGKHPEVYRRYVELRGAFLKEMLTDDVIGAYAEAAKENPTEAQSQLTRDVGDKAREAAVYKIEEEILDGKLKL